MSTPTDRGPSDDADRGEGADAGGRTGPVDDEDDDRSARPVTDDDYDELGAGD